MVGPDVLFLGEFDFDEIEAVVLGSQWVSAHGDPTLARAARAVIGRIAVASSQGLRRSIEAPIAGIPPPRGHHQDVAVDVARLRSWIRHERKLALRYVDDAGVRSVRTVWPFLMGYGETYRMLIAWCELPDGFRMFRTDRLTAVEFVEHPFPRDREDLRRRWLKTMEERDVTRASTRRGT